VRRVTTETLGGTINGLLPGLVNASCTQPRVLPTCSANTLPAVPMGFSGRGPYAAPVVGAMDTKDCRRHRSLRSRSSIIRARNYSPQRWNRAMLLALPGSSRQQARQRTRALPGSLIQSYRSSFLTDYSAVAH
jgi:hypothetical protein